MGRGRSFWGWLGALTLALAPVGRPAIAQVVDKGADATTLVPWVVYYADKAPIDSLLPYQLLVLDSTYHPPLERLKDHRRTLLGYLSVGEVEEHRPWFAKVKSWGILDEENPNWPGSHYVDVRDKRWVKLVVEELVPALLKKGFNGVFLDTLDNPPHLERTDPVKWKGMTRAAARLVAAIHRDWPEIPIMQNRGYELLPNTAASLTHVLGESVRTTWNFQLERAQMQSEADYEFQVAALKAARVANPKIQVMTLDYWDPTDTKMVRELYATQRANGFSPYVSTVKLDQVFPEPEPDR